MPATYLTREGYEKLQEELEYLRKVKRQEVAARLHEAMEGGELIEDAEYEAAKNEQAFIEGRIQDLEILLANARVIEGKAKSDVVQVGTTVTVKENGNEPEIYTIVGPAEANPRCGKISNESPIGQALMGKKVNEKVKVNTPAGEKEYKVLEVM